VRPRRKESVLGGELMTPLIENFTGPSPLSRVTLGALEDFWGEGAIDYDQADDYSCSSPGTWWSPPAPHRRLLEFEADARDTEAERWPEAPPPGGILRPRIAGCVPEQGQPLLPPSRAAVDREFLQLHLAAGHQPPPAHQPVRLLRDTLGDLLDWTGLDDPEIVELLGAAVAGRGDAWSPSDAPLPQVEWAHRGWTERLGLPTKQEVAAEVARAEQALPERRVLDA
jgi:hypothetical protein